MRMHTSLLACLLALSVTTGCMGGGDDGAGDGGTGTPAGDGGAGGGANDTAPMEIANGSLTLGPTAGDVVPGTNGTAVLEVNVTEPLSNVVVNTTITQGSSVGLRFYGLGACTGEVGNPAQPGRTYTAECGAVEPGTYNLTFVQSSGTVTFRVNVLGSR